MPHGDGSKTGILMELRTLFEGYAGIPQEMRIMFDGFSKSTSYRLSGLLNGGGYAFKPKKFDGHNKANQIFSQTQSILAYETGLYQTPLIPTRLVPARRRHQLAIALMAGSTEKLENKIDQNLFSDFLWTRLFEKSLPASARESVLSRNIDFLFARTSGWRAAWLSYIHPMARIRLATENHDIFFAASPSPYRVANNTQQIIRYHDAIPILQPHTIGDPWAHANSHFKMLSANMADGAWFFCDSDPVRNDLLAMFPRAERRVFTLPVMASPEYKPVEVTSREIAGILKRRICEATKPSKMDDRGGYSSKDLTAAPRYRPIGAEGEAIPRYIMAVSTLEPRKNYKLLLRAFAAIKNAGAGKEADDLKMVVVANPGWRCEGELAEIKPLVVSGDVIHLANVPLEELRKLYSAAQLVVCPSRAEGFDLSGIEAMQCGTPVLASSIPVHQWVYGEAAEYFDPYDWENLSRLLIDATKPRSLDGRLSQLKERGFVQSALYSPKTLMPRWEEAIEKVRGLRVMAA